MTPDPVPTPAGNQNATAGRIVDATSGAAAAAAVAIDGDRINKTTSSAAGTFTIVATADLTDPRSVAFTSQSFVSRQTYMRVPGPDALVSLIPSGFDLAAFDQMFRNSSLERWTNAPPLRIQTQTLQFTRTDAATMTALDDSMSNGEYASLLADVTWALPQLTGSAFSAFASVSREAARAGDDVSLLNPGVITIARVKGLTSATGYWGYSRWQTSNDGGVVSGLSMIDVDFDRSGSPFARSLRSHELGHSLGYSHVSGRLSVMNPDARTEPNDFDRAGSRIAFQRRPGNRTPDVDPTPIASVNRAAARWSAPVF